ncbi:MAG: UDP-N-acetylglucosamine 2-epimerase (non-hydrolyzing) [Chitinivibrionia bacterium]|nr:UDP-N-acetylglucosamine 2-epimerase (non-hydrolyzing) [Chitinivibrionia bacterium]
MARKIMGVVGARPNFMKMAPIWRVLAGKAAYSRVLVHTGQHYDDNMSRIFFDDLRLPKPDVYLGVGSGSHGAQTGTIMIEFEKALLSERADLVMVVGDVNSTMACSLVAVKMGVPVAHVEAGLRSFDRTMPEEINRMVTDIVADLLFTTCAEAGENLIREHVDARKIHFVGNVMIDSLYYYSPLADASPVLDTLALEKGGYGLVTLHRPSNVDEFGTFKKILDALLVLGERCPLVFPVHPRTRKMLATWGTVPPPDRIRMLDPVGYLDFLKLMKHARIVLTDSGGIQEETTVLGIPCLTIRENTERPITITVGTNVLTGSDTGTIVDEGLKALAGGAGRRGIPELWDGRASERIAGVIDAYFS